MPSMIPWLEALEARAERQDAGTDEEADAALLEAVGRLPWYELGALADAITATQKGQAIDAGTEEKAFTAWQKLVDELGAEWENALECA